MSVLVETRQLVKNYMQGKIIIPALRGIDLQIQEGEFIAILGPSGSGKSTLLNLLGALDYPTSGDVLISGTNIAQLNAKGLSVLRQKIGFVFQYYNLISRLTALQNVLLGIKIRGDLPAKEERALAVRLLGLVGLEDRINHRPTELSGGQQQRVAIARALAQRPHFLLMDEPTGNVDTKTRDTILDLIQSLNRHENITVIMITHDPKVAARAHRTLYLVDGLIQINNPNGSENGKQTRLENSNQNRNESELQKKLERSNDSGNLSDSSPKAVTHGGSHP